MSKFVDLTSGMVADIIAVTPSDTVDIDGFVVGLYVTDGGDISFETQGGTRTITVPDNFIITCIVKRVNSTGTTADGIHAFLI